jgi:cbb3-type cytochrome oxidase subunit 3
LIAWAFWPSRRAEMDRNSRIPLRDDDYRDDDNGR